MNKKEMIKKLLQTDTFVESIDMDYMAEKGLMTLTKEEVFRKLIANNEEEYEKFYGHGMGGK